MSFCRPLSYVMMIALALAALGVVACENQGAEYRLPSNTPLPLSIRQTNPPIGQESQPYSAIFQRQGGTPPFTWSEIGAGIPGLQLTSNGILQGIPSTPGTTLYDVQVVDSGVPQQSATARFSIEIQSATGGGGGTNHPPIFTTFPTTDAELVIQTNQPYSFQFDAIDPNGDPMVFAISQQPLQGGATISATGLFDWNPPADNISCITVTVSDGVNPDVSFTFSIESNATGQGQKPPQPARITSVPILSAKQGSQYIYNATVNAGAGAVAWTLTGPPAGTLPGSTMAIDPQTGSITWIPDASHVTPTGGLGHLVEIRANNGGQCGNGIQVFRVVVAPGTLPPSPIRVIASGVNGSNPQRSYIRSMVSIDPNIPTAPVDVPSATARTFRNGSARLGLTGPRHSLRIGAGEPREVNLNSGMSYIQCPTYPATDPGGTNPAASCRLYHFTDVESGTALTGALDAIAAVDTYGTVQVFSFPTNIHEEIYVPRNFASHPRFVVTSADGKQMWLCRVDRVNYAGGLTTTGNMLTVDMSALGANEEVQHQSITLAGNLDYWFTVRDSVSNASRIFRTPTDGGPGADPVAVNVLVPTMPATAQISAWFARSGNGNRIAFVAGDNLSIGINSGTMDGVNRDIWVIDGPTRTITRATNFAANRPAAPAPDIRLIEVFESNPTYQQDFAAHAINDTGGNDNRVIFGTSSTQANSTHVGHALNFDGTLVAFVVIETNAGSGDGSASGTGVRDEVYVAGVDTAGATAGHDVIRVTAAPTLPALPPSNPGGRLANSLSAFELNMGVVTGLFFPQRGSSGGKDRRLYFAFGDGTSVGSLREYGTRMYAAEFTVNGTNPIAHVSTTDRSTGSPAGPNGFTITDPANDLSMFLGTYETATPGFLTIVRLLGTSGAPAAGARAQLCYLDLSVDNASVVANGTGTIRQYETAGAQPVDVYELDDDRTLFGSGLPGASPFGPGGAVLVPTVASLFGSVSGPTVSATMEGIAFVVAKGAALGGGEDLFMVSLTAPATTPAANLTAFPTAGRINSMDISADGVAVAVHRGASVAPFPDVLSGNSYLGNQIFLIPNVGAAAAAPTPPVSLNIPAANHTAITGQWVNSTPITGTAAPSFQYWFAHGSSVIVNSAPESQMTLYRVGVDPITGVVSNSAPVDASIAVGAIVIYGSGD